MAYTRSQLFGGAGGAEFKDDLTEVAALTSVVVRHADIVGSIRCTWLTTDGSTREGEWHGGPGGAIDSFSLDDGEFLTEVAGTHSSWVTQLHFTTNRGRRFGPYGKSLWPGKQHEFKIAPKGQAIGGFIGRSASVLDSLGVYTTDRQEITPVRHLRQGRRM
ncbi:jacalin-like lectin [Streptomyces sp. GbtcB6]|uniref:jacalin-like lectin n=1 Tax=Streptomyces sp. GbtcB6 TaxID=2824751 RepID=UPI001C2F57D5|nr:jacalin-like lectin [Streptomyces sp. GbtcB6]